MEIHRQVERMLAEELLEFMNGEKDRKLEWTGTVAHLVEVVHYLFLACIIKDENGLAATKKSIAQRAFGMFGRKMPCNLSTYVSRIGRMKGVRSMSLLEMNVASMESDKGYMGLKKMVKQRDLYTEKRQTHK